jgi:hypothetical protein
VIHFFPRRQGQGGSTVEQNQETRQGAMTTRFQIEALEERIAPTSNPGNNNPPLTTP